MMIKPTFIGIWRTALGCFLAWAAVSAVPAEHAAAEIRFKDVSETAGIHNMGATFGASWGDFNGDGWPDIWVSNHNRTPALYLNKQNGTFEDVIQRVWSANPDADTHGAAWADFDNDGDQDLVELVDVSSNADGTLCMGCGKNHFFVNDGKKLKESAAAFGLDHIGQGRSPLWFDADNDGRLDLLVANVRKAPDSVSMLWLQQKDHRFAPAGPGMGFKDGPWESSEKIRGRIRNALNFSLRKLPKFNAVRGLESAQLADLSSDGQLDLLLFTLPSRAFDVTSIPFKDVTNQMALPDLSRIKDAAIADFNGDLKLDMFISEGAWLTSHVIRNSPSEIGGMITWSGRHTPKAVTFRSQGEVEFQIHPTWLPLSMVYIGSSGRHPDSRRFTLSPDDPEVRGAVDTTAEGFQGVTISYDADASSWTIRNVQRSWFVDFIARASGGIEDFKTEQFDLFKVDGSGVLFIHEKGGYARAPLVAADVERVSCISVVTADFDNDMDMDIYMVCTGPIMNFPNRLLENDGNGNFILVPDAGGAAGTDIGRGDVAAVADYDRDGFLDIFVANGADPASPFVAKAPHQLFRNRGNGNHWLEIDLEGVRSNRDAIGARLELEAGGVKQVRHQTGGMHRIAQDHQRLHFGLAGNVKVDRITISWPSGTVQHLSNVQADQILHIKEASGDSK